MNTEKETLSTEDEESIDEEVNRLKEVVEDRPLCQPIATLEECITADLVITGIYPLLCNECRNKIRNALVSLQLANAETFLERLDFMRFIK